jgi:hypothetical protein
VTDVDRRALLAGLATLVATGHLEDSVATGERESRELELQACDVCDAEHHPDDVEFTTVATSPIPGHVCRSCQWRENYNPEERCRSCGQELDGDGQFVELEFPLGVSEFPARLSGQLCGDCAGHLALRARQAPREHTEAKREFLDLMDEMTRRSNELRDDWPPEDDDE